MNWKLLTEENQLTQIIEESGDKLILIFKNSTRCSTSTLALNRLERNWDKGKMQNFEIYYVDVIQNRRVSNKIETNFGVTHQSPQVLVIKNGQCIYNQSHLWISYGEIEKLNDKISV